MGLFKKRIKMDGDTKSNVDKEEKKYNFDKLLESKDDEEEEERRKKQILQSYIDSYCNPTNNFDRTIKTNNLSVIADSGINFNEMGDDEQIFDEEEFGRSIPTGHSIIQNKLTGSKEKNIFNNSVSISSGTSSYKRRRLVGALRPHLYKNNIIKAQLLNDVRMDKMNSIKRNEFIERFKAAKGYGNTSNTSSNSGKQLDGIDTQKLKQRKEAPAKLTEKKKVDPTARLIYDAIIFDPKRISREFDKVRYNDELVNKVISTRIDRTLSKIRKNKYRVTKTVRLMLFTDLCIIEQAIQRGFRPKYMKIDRQLFEASHYDSSITLTESLHEIALCFGRQGNFRTIKKIDGVDKEKDITNYVLYNLNNPMAHLNAVRNKLEHISSKEDVMERER